MRCTKIQNLLNTALPLRPVLPAEAFETKKEKPNTSRRKTENSDLQQQTPENTRLTPNTPTQDFREPQPRV
jgi:hypothetical protein